MAEFTANEIQTIAPGGVALFTETTVNPTGRTVYHREGSGIFSLRGFASCCRGFAKFKIHFGGNIAITEEGTPTPTPQEVSLALAISGEPESVTTMSITPSALGEYFNISRDVTVKVPVGCCTTISVENISTQSIDLRNAIIDIDWEG